MSFRVAWVNSLKSLKLRAKLILAFAGMAVMTGLCGAVGLLFVDRIGANVSIFSDVTSPLLIESMALVENARHMRSVFFAATVTAEGIEQFPKQISDIRAESAKHLATLSELATKAQIKIPSNAIEQREREYVQTLYDMLTAYRAEQNASAASRERVADFVAKKSEVEAILLSLANRAEGNIFTIEDEAKVQVQTGAAKVDVLGGLISDALTEAYPLVQGATKLMREIEQIEDWVKLALVESSTSGFNGLQEQVKENFRIMGSLSKKLAGRLRDADGQSEFATIRQGLGELEAALLGPRGVFFAQRETIAVRAAFAAGRETLDRIDRAYLAILDDVQRAVSDRNRVVRQYALNGIVNARYVIAGSVSFAVFAGLAFALFFSHRVTGPLVRLTNHTINIGKSGELSLMPDVAVISRTDEIGTLSRAFNLMIGELADARQQLIDVSEAKIRTQYERLNAAINNMPQGLCMFDAEQKLIVCNKKYAEIYALNPAYAVPGTPLRLVLEDHVAKGISPENSPDYVAKRLAAAAERKPFYFINELRDGHVIAITYQPMANGGSVATHEDITERRKVEAKIAYMAHHDALTDLPNRVTFRVDMENALASIARGGTVAVLCLDLDHFKEVNDTLGHPVGDVLLQAVAQRIRDCVRPTDNVARLGGDEFAIVQLVADQPIGSTALAQRLVKELGEPFDVQGHQVVIGASVGIAIAPNDGGDPDLLMKNADMALYRAKEDGRGAYRFFEPAMDAKMQLRRALELDLRKAVALGEFELVYQPTINLRTKEVAGFEALLRWRHPQRGLVSPLDFIPLTEEIGLINQIGSWVLKEACREAMKWPADIRVAVNLSPVQFKGGAVVLDVMAALCSSGLPPHRLELEITETVLLQDTESTVATLNRLRELGVQIAMDDFGTGYSSLGYLRKFPFDRIKIDRSFIHDLVEKPDSIAIVRAVTGLGATLGIATTAEGVETEEQLRKLTNECCTEVQGYLFSEPKPASELLMLLQQLNPISRAVA